MGSTLPCDSCADGCRPDQLRLVLEPRNADAAAAVGVLCPGQKQERTEGRKGRRSVGKNGTRKEGKEGKKEEMKEGRKE